MDRMHMVRTWRKSRHSNPNGACVEASGWITSSYSSHNGQCVEAASGWITSSHGCESGACVEAGNWRKSSCSGYNNSCVEAGSCSHGGTAILLRDSTLGDASPVLSFGPAAFAAFTGSLKVR